MQKLTLKLQIWIGFILVLTLTTLVAFTSIYFLVQVNRDANYIASEAQPTMIDALVITNDLNITARIINAYIVTHEASDRNALADSLKQLNTHLSNYAQLNNVNQHKNLIEKVNVIKNLVKKFNEHIKKIEYLIHNPIDNYPALALSASKINPLNQSVLSSLDQAIRSEIEEDNTQERKLLLIALSDLRHNWMNIITSNRSFLSTPSDSREEKTQVYRKNHASLLTSLQEKQDIFTFEQEEAVESVLQDSKKHLLYLDEIYNLFKSGNWRKDQQLLTHELQPLIKEISTHLSDITNEQKDYTLSLSQGLLDEISTAILITIITLCAAIIIGIGIAWSNVRQINNIVTEVSTSLEKMSHGDFDVNLNENQAGETGQVAAIINNFSTQLKSMINNLTSSVNQLELASTDMSSIISESSDNILQQHRETEMVATAVKQMTSTSLEVAGSASTAATSSKQANELAESGAKISTEALGGINHLVKDLDNASGVIENLKNESNNISVVLDVIRDISEQTNLLALNAAIEAARAGEQGRGFAVVADEVRTLASRTQESTDEIRNKIDQLQNGANDAVQAMDSAIKEVTLNSAQVKKVADSLNAIANEIQTINRQITQMAAASEQQSSTAEEISRNIVSISLLAEKTAQGTALSEKAEDDLSMVTRNIQNVIKEFKT